MGDNPQFVTGHDSEGNEYKWQLDSDSIVSGEGELNHMAFFDPSLLERDIIIQVDEKALERFRLFISKGDGMRDEYRWNERAGAFTQVSE